uniref:non-specific serine/threonine protein kinase n=1 Tax=Petromyzon marinus TaxID=7757 RepID=S4RAV0_PETMA
MGQANCICSRGIFSIDDKRYFFIEQLGEGGFSYVDLVEGAHNGRFYALKRIVCHDKDDHKGALREVEMHRAFRHPNVLPLEGSRVVERGPKCEVWLLLPYYQRGTLWDELEKLRNKHSFMTEERIVGIFRGICSGLKDIHDKGFAHRDLKPTNVLLSDEDVPVLMDLGSMEKARIEIKNSREAMALQVTRAVRCTISYRAPELFTVPSHCIIDARTDIWSLGCVLFAMMFLEGPFDGVFQRGDSVALAVQSSVNVPSSSRYSQPLRKLLTSLMDVDPSERPTADGALEQANELRGTFSSTHNTAV